LGLYSNEHLTTAQLSAYLDEELTRNELALCAAHLQVCPQCQAVLADLRVTSLLLRGLPQIEVPRSFVLSPALTVLPTTPGRHRARGMRPVALRRPLRVFSTLAAVVGLLFMLLASPALLPTAASPTGSASAPVLSSAAGNRANTPPASGTRSAVSAGSVTQQARATARVQGQQSPAAAGSGTTFGLQTDQPVVLDPAQPAGQLEIGALLLALGILGLVLTRRPRRQQN